jgi:hypothetical protein
VGLEKRKNVPLEEEFECFGSYYIAICIGGVDKAKELNIFYRNKADIIHLRMVFYHYGKYLCQ